MQSKSQLFHLTSLALATFLLLGFVDRVVAQHVGRYDTHKAEATMSATSTNSSTLSNTSGSLHSWPVI